MQAAANTTLTLTIHDSKQLYDYHMPFIDGCGLFVPTASELALGKHIRLRLTLPNIEPIEVLGKVVWLNPKQQQGKRVPGVGVQLLGETNQAITATITAQLQAIPLPPLPTATL